MAQRVLPYLIIGAGPGGLQLAYYLARAGHEYQVLDRGAGAGAFYETFPRHRKLISSNKVYTGLSDPERQMRFDWNSLLTEDHAHLFRDYSKRYFAGADDLVRYLRDFAAKYVPQIRYGIEVKQVSRENGIFVVRDGAGGEHRAQRLIVATGNSQPFIPDVPGIEHGELYGEVDVDPDRFIDQRVLIVGKGNSAFETADNLVETTAMIHLSSPHPLKFAWTTHYPGHLRAVNNNLLDTYQLKTQNVIIDGAIESIEKLADGTLRANFAYAHASGERQSIVYDRVIVCTGFRFDASIFDDSCRPALAISDRFPALTGAWESVNVPGLYFAGALTQSRDFKKSNSAFIHGFRYNSRALFRILEQRYEQRPWPSREVEASPDGLVDAALHSVNHSSALWQQFSFIGDCIVLEGGKARIHESMPVDLIRDAAFGDVEHCFVVTLEFGEHHGDPFAVVRTTDPMAGDQSIFLHPVIRHFHRGMPLREFHVLEDLFVTWTSEKAHRAPLRRFFEEQLQQANSTVRPLMFLDALAWGRRAGAPEMSAEMAEPSACP